MLCVCEWVSGESTVKQENYACNFKVKAYNRPYSYALFYSFLDNQPITVFKDCVIASNGVSPASSLR